MFPFIAFVSSVMIKIFFPVINDDAVSGDKLLQNEM